MTAAVRPAPAALFAAVGWLWTVVAAVAVGVAVAAPELRAGAVFWAVLGAAMGPSWILYARSGSATEDLTTGLIP